MKERSFVLYILVSVFVHASILTAAHRFQVLPSAVIPGNAIPVEFIVDHEESIRSQPALAAIKPTPKATIQEIKSRSSRHIDTAHSSPDPADPIAASEVAEPIWNMGTSPTQSISTVHPKAEKVLTKTMVRTAEKPSMLLSTVKPQLPSSRLRLDSPVPMMVVGSRGSMASAQIQNPLKVVARSEKGRPQAESISPRPHIPEEEIYPPKVQDDALLAGGEIYVSPEGESVLSKTKTAMPPNMNTGVAFSDVKPFLPVPDFSAKIAVSGMLVASEGREGSEQIQNPIKVMTRSEKGRPQADLISPTARIPEEGIYPPKARIDDLSMGREIPVSPEGESVLTKVKTAMPPNTSTRVVVSDIKPFLPVPDFSAEIAVSGMLVTSESPAVSARISGQVKIMPPVTGSRLHVNPLSEPSIAPIDHLPPVFEQRKMTLKEPPHYAPNGAKTPLIKGKAVASLRSGAGAVPREKPAEFTKIMAPNNKPAVYNLDIISSFPFPGSPSGASYLFVIDTSGSVKGSPLEGIKASASEFVELMGENDRIGILTFNDRPIVDGSFTTEKKEINQIIEKLRTAGKKTVLYDALIEASRLISREGQGNKIIVLFSDGKDEGSRTTLDSVMGEMHRWGISILCVGYTRVEKKYLEILNKLAQDTKGVFVYAPQLHDIMALYKVSRGAMISAADIEKAIGATRKNRFEEAIALFDEIAAREPSLLSRITTPYAQVLTGKASELLETDPIKAKTLLQKSVALYSGNVQGLSMLGSVYIQLKEYPQAIDAFQKVVDQEPQSATPLFNLGYIYTVTREYAKAENMFARVVELSPPFLEEALFNLAWVEHRQGKLKQCIINLKRALEINPDNKQADEYLRKVEAEASAMEPQLPAATEEHEMTEMEFFDDALKALGEKRFGEAVTLFQEVLACQPSEMEKISSHYASALEGRAAELVATDPEKAKVMLLEAIELKPESIQGLLQLGSLYLNTKDYDKAIESFRSAAVLDVENDIIYFNLGYLYAITRKYAKAEEMYDRVVGFAPPYLDEALYNLAMVQEKQGKKKQSIRNLEQALKVNPGNELAKKHLNKLNLNTFPD